MKPVLEVCTHSVESAVSAERGGAMRLELCANLMIGGTSPDEDLFRMVRERVSVPVRVLLRPRCGDFLYTESEFELLCRQVKRFAALGADAIAEAIDEIANGTAQRVPQNEAEATYAPMLSRELSPIDWTRSSTQVIDQIRGLIPWPCAAASILGANTKIFRAVPLGETKDAPGTLRAMKKGIEAACGDGKSILITELQQDGGKRMAANAFLNGKRIAAGTVLDA